MLELLAAVAVACAVPANLTPAPATTEGEARVLPIEKYVLAWYWWPENCAGHPGEGCGQHFGFKLHGLWPDGAGETYPQFCRPADALPVATVRANWCLTPSTTLLQHEWAKHGTCHWPDPDTYFAEEQRLAATVTMPDAGGARTAGRLRDRIVAANPALPRAALFVGTDNKHRLTEVRLCLDTRFAPMACEGNRIGAGDEVPVKVRRR